MPLSINLAEKYSPKVVDKFYRDSVVLGKTSKEYDWDGVKTVKVWTINTYDPVDYTRPSSNPVLSTSGGAIVGAHARYGNTYEVEDTIQTMELKQDKAVSLSVDKGNNTEEMLIKNAGKVMNLEMRERFIPMFDKLCIAKWSGFFGNSATAPSWKDLVQVAKGGTAVINKSNIVTAISDGITAIRNENTDVDDAYCYIGETEFANLLMADEFIHYANATYTPRNIEKGVMGKIRGLQVVPVPDSYLLQSVVVSDVTTAVNNPFLTKDLHFIIVKKSAVLAPTKIKDMKVHSDPVGISGALMEIRWLFDAFALDTKAKGIYVCTKEAVDA